MIVFWVLVAICAGVLAFVGYGAWLAMDQRRRRPQQEHAHRVILAQLDTAITAARALRTDSAELARRMEQASPREDEERIERLEQELFVRTHRHRPIRHVQ